MRYPHGPPHTGHTVWARPADHTRPPGQPGYGPPPRGPTPKGSNPSRISLRGPLSIVLIAVIVVSLVAGGLLAAELYTRHTVNSRVAASAECVVGDKVTVSVGLKPLLLQHMTSDYGPISIITAGNQIRGAKRMKAEVEIDNVHLDGNDQSKGTIGVLDAAVTWPSSGITRSVQDAIPLLSSFVSGARTHPLDGTIELRGRAGQQHHRQAEGRQQRDFAAGGQSHRARLDAAPRGGAVGAKNAHIGADVAADHHVVARHERVRRTVIPNGQLGRWKLGHRRPRGHLHQL
ncbi:MAG TPA: LmeA family phospholipid-binding protein [Mycobacterium sp.]